MCEECLGGLCVSLRLVVFICNHRYAIMVMTAVMKSRLSALRCMFCPRSLRVRVHVQDKR